MKLSTNFISPSLFCCLLLLAGCLAKTNSDVTLLLERQYQDMSDAELIAYEQELNDALIQSARTDNGGVNVGIGFGSWGSNVGYGVRADRRLGDTGSGETETALRVRREDVRAEMRRRGLLLPSG